MNVFKGVKDRNDSKFILLEYFCSYDCKPFLLSNDIEFHNRIPLQNLYGKEQFHDLDEFLNMFKRFKNDIVGKSRNLYYQLCIFGFKKIFIKSHIRNILKSYKIMCEQGNQKNMIGKYIHIKNLCEDPTNNFLIESRLYDWNKSCRIYILISFIEDENNPKMYPLFIDINHICCHKNSGKDIDALKNFLNDDNNFIH